MPDVTVSANVDTMMRAADNAAIRSAIGLGQTDAPTFLAQSLTGQSLTGTQATSLVDLSATWNTTGNPSLIYGRVTNTNSGTTANLIDLGTFAGGSLFNVSKAGAITIGAGSAKLEYTPGGSLTLRRSSGGAIMFTANPESNNLSIGSVTTDVVLNLANNTRLELSTAGVVEQRNGTNAQAFRVYNTYTDASNYERVSIGHSAGAFQILSDALGTGAAKQLQIGTNTAASLVLTTANTLRWQVTSAGHFLAVTDNAYDIGASGANRPRNLYIAGSFDALGSIASPAFYAGPSGNATAMTTPTNGVFRITNNSATDLNRIQLGGSTDAFPAIARDGAGIKFTGAAAGLTSWIKVPAVAVSALPSAATAGVGARSFVNDALTPVFGSAVTGGGAVTAPVYSTGSAWNVG